MKTNKNFLDGLHKTYNNKLEVLKGIDLDVTEGEVLVIIGPSGGGKSTFLRCMNGLEDYVAPFVYGGPTLGLMVAHSKCDPLSHAFGEVGLTAGLGFEIVHRWQITGSYTWGLTYALKTLKLDNYSGRNRQLSVGLTYFF